MGYKLSQKAEEDIIHLYLEGLQKFGPAQAEEYHNGLESTFQFLSDYPEAARVRDEITPPVRVHPYESHIIIYVTQNDGKILILRVRHAREDWVNDADV